MFCRKGAIFSIPYRRKTLSDNEVKRAGDGLHPNRIKFRWESVSMVLDVPGIIVAYDAMTGVVLLKSKPHRSLDEVAENYRCSKNDQGFWLAKFMWSVVDQRDKDYVQATLAGRLVRDVILGCQVVCRLEKRPKWQADHIRVLLDHDKFDLPERRSRPGGQRRTEKTKNCNGLTKFARSKLDGKGGGIVLGAVGGRKPGSHRS